MRQKRLRYVSTNTRLIPGVFVCVGKNLDKYTSGQREQTVNLPAHPSQVRILPYPPVNWMHSNVIGSVPACKVGALVALEVQVLLHPPILPL